MADFTVQYLDPYVAVSEQKMIIDGQIILKHLVDRFTRMRVQNYFETTNESEIPASDGFFL